MCNFNKCRILLIEIALFFCFFELPVVYILVLFHMYFLSDEFIKYVKFQYVYMCFISNLY